MAIYSRWPLANKQSDYYADRYNIFEVFTGWVEIVGISELCGFLKENNLICFHEFYTRSQLVVEHRKTIF